EGPRLFGHGGIGRELQEAVEAEDEESEPQQDAGGGGELGAPAIVAAAARSDPAFGCPKAGSGGTPGPNAGPDDRD
ncbi:MAG: hypothetical protein AAF501_15100, partial [Pseudomonadota bacterium]